MIKVEKGNYFFIALCLILTVIVIILSGCGSGGNSVVVSNTDTTDNPVNYNNPTPTPVLTNVNVSGYIYASNTVTEDGETVPGISILDVPACQADASGNQPFVIQVSNSLQQDYPEDWQKPEVQELYNQLNKTLSESKPLPQFSSESQVYSVYNDTSIPVSADGHFDNSVLTGATDNTVKLEVAMGEDNYTEVETFPFSDNINSSDATTAVLKSCPENIFAFPGEIVIFKVQAEPGINLKSAGLKFTLENPSIGCLTQPIYLCIFGKNKYQTSYGCLYVKKGLNTPLASNITATTNTGLSLKIFTEIIKSTARISGTVYTGGTPLVKGFVRSLGTKACCKIDSSGQYSLPKVFMGHYRKVVCTYWTTENGQKVRHREEKVIDFFDKDLAGFNFGVPPTPTPALTPTATPTPREVTDKFYDVRVSNVAYQYNKWEKEFSKEEAIQKTADWLNGQSSIPVPGEITGASRDIDSNVMWIYFADGMSVFLDFTTDNYMIDGSISSPKSKKSLLQENSSNFLNKSINSSGIITTKSSKILMLAPFVWQEEIWNYNLDHRVYTELADKLTTKKDPLDSNKPLYEVKKVVTHRSDIVYGTNYWDPNDRDKLIVPFQVSTTGKDNIVSPYDYMDIYNYGVIYIATHGLTLRKTDGTIVVSGIYCGPFVEDDEDTSTWIQYNKDKRYDPNHPTGLWTWAYLPHQDWDPNTLPVDPNGNKAWSKGLFLSKDFFKGQNFSGSIIYMSACYSWDLRDTFNSADVYLGHANKDSGLGQVSASQWSRSLAYYFFYYMMEGYKDPNDVPNYAKDSANPVGPIRPMSVNEAYKSLWDQKVNPDPAPWGEPAPECKDCKLYLHQKQTSNEIYFPVPVTITVEKSKK